MGWWPYILLSLYIYFVLFDFLCNLVHFSLNGTRAIGFVPYNTFSIATATVAHHRCQSRYCQSQEKPSDNLLEFVVVVDFLLLLVFLHCFALKPFFRLWILGFRRRKVFFSFVALSAFLFVCIRLRHSTGDEVDVTPLSVRLRWSSRRLGEIDWCRFSYIGTTPALPKGTRARWASSSYLFPCKIVLEIWINM